jgi:anti-sigma factor ChrR (cupin superfamily)
MSERERDLEAAELALRVQDGKRSGRADGEAADPAVARWEVRLGVLAAAVPPMTPPQAVFDRALAQVRGARSAPSTSGGGTLTVRAEEGSWRFMAPGVTVKTLWRDRRSGRWSALLRVEPGAIYPPHDHDEDEECLVLEGELRFGDLLLKAGDFHLARKGHRHPGATSAGGCLLYLSGAHGPREPASR